MKINFLKSIIAIATSALIAYSFYSFHSSENINLLVFGSFLFLTITLILSIGAKFEQHRTTVNINIISGIFSFIALASNVSFSFFSFLAPVYLLINGLLFLVFLLIIYSIYQAKQ